MNDFSSADRGSGELLEILFRHKKKLILTPLMILLLATGVILWAPRTYRSEAKLFLQVGHESVGLEPLATTGQTLSLMQDGQDSEVTSAMDILGSRGVVGKVVDEMGSAYVLNGGPLGEGGDANPVTAAILKVVGGAINLIKSIDPVSDREEAIILLSESLTIEAERDSTVIVASLQADTPLGAQQMLAKIVEVYQREHLRIHRNPDSRTFLTEQSELLKSRLEQANEAVKNAKNRMGLASVAGRRSTLETQLSAVEQGAYSAEQNLATQLAQVTDLRQQLQSLPERMVASRRSIPNEGADLLRNQLYVLQTRKAELEARYKENHPLVMAISAQLDEAEKVVEDQAEKREETTDDINPIHRELSLQLKQAEAAMAGFDARLKVLQEQKDLILRDLKQLNHDEVELDALMRDVSVARNKYITYAENLEQARIDQELESQKISSISVAQEATLSEKPVSPSKLLVGLGAMVLAFGSTVTWILGSEQLNDKLRSAEEVEHDLQVPVLAEIPKSQVHGRVLNY